MTLAFVSLYLLQPKPNKNNFSFDFKWQQKPFNYRPLFINPSVRQVYSFPIYKYIVYIYKIYIYLFLL